MDLVSFDHLIDQIWALPTMSARLAVQELTDPRSIHIVIRPALLPSVSHYIIVCPAKLEGMVIRKWWTRDEHAGIETPLQGIASPAMVLHQVLQLMAT